MMWITLRIKNIDVDNTSDKNIDVDNIWYGSETTLDITDKTSDKN